MNKQTFLPNFESEIFVRFSLDIVVMASFASQYKSALALQIILYSL